MSNLKMMTIIIICTASYTLGLYLGVRVIQDAVKQGSVEIESQEHGVEFYICIDPRTRTNIEKFMLKERKRLTDIRNSLDNEQDYENLKKSIQEILNKEYTEQDIKGNRK